MIRDITLGQFYPGNSWVHKLDPRVKIIATLLFLIELFIVNDFLGFAIAAVVLGVERLHGAAVRCTDLRGGAALCAAALAAEGETAISDITHIDRGYQSIEDDLAALGADIR